MPAPPRSPAPRLPDAAPSPSPVALVVANPTEEIDVLPQEIHAAARSSSTRGWELEAPEPVAASRERVMNDLARAQLFVFFGHGDHEPPRARPRPPTRAVPRAGPLACSSPLPRCSRSTTC